MAPKVNTFVVVFVVVVVVVDGFVFDEEENRQKSETKTTNSPINATRAKLIRKIAEAEGGDLFFGKYGRIHQLRDETNEESIFAEDFVQIHFSSGDHVSHVINQEQQQQQQQRHQRRRRRRRRRRRSDSTTIGREIPRSPSSSSSFSTRHLVTDIRSHERLDAISVGLSGADPVSGADRHSGADLDSGADSGVHVYNPNLGEESPINPTKPSSTPPVPSPWRPAPEARVPLRIPAEGADWHEVEEENSAVETEGAAAPKTTPPEVEIMEAPDPEVAPAPRINLDPEDDASGRESENLPRPTTTTTTTRTTTTTTTTTTHPNHREFSPRRDLRGSTPEDETRIKREKIKEMMLHSWNNYVEFAWGDNELRPVTKQPHRATIYGSARLGATIVDSLSTLYLMGLESEFERGRLWIARDFHLNYDAFVSVFETNIRILGGLLSAYAMTGYTIFKTKSVEVAEKLMPAFDTPTGIPYGLISLRNGNPHAWMWAQGKSILAEIGTMHLEFVYLSNITGNPVYAQKVKKIRTYLDKLQKPDGGLYPNYVDPQTGLWGSHHVSIGALGDSFYEYLLKSWLQTGKKDLQARRMYDEAIQRISQVLFQRSPQSNLLYIAEYESRYIKRHMGHLACFAGGMFTLGAAGGREAGEWRKVGREIGFTCKQAYNRTAVGIGPEGFDFSYSYEAVSSMYGSRYYALRPEVIETWFYLWRFTKNEIYRTWAWEFVQSLELHCRTPHGFSGLRDVYDSNSHKDNVQQSFFLAETLKYLYLIFSEDDALPLDEWVFNTEAHPLPVLHNYPDELLVAPEVELLDVPSHWPITIWKMIFS